MSNKITQSLGFIKREDLVDSLTDTEKLGHVVAYLLSADRDKVKDITKDTTKSGYRKIHEILTSAIDRSLEILRQKKSAQEITQESVSTLNMMFTRALIFVHYQTVRGQTNKTLASLLTDIIKEILKEIDNIKNKGDSRVLIKKLESARAILDTILVVIHRYSR